MRDAIRDSKNCECARHSHRPATSELFEVLGQVSVSEGFSMEWVMDRFERAEGHYDVVS